MTTDLDRLVADTEAWLAIDPDPGTVAALRAVLDDVRAGGDATILDDLMGRRLDFGTAGLRGEMGPGRNRLNRLIARQTAAGLAAALLEHAPDAVSAGVLVGHDARHHSTEFARDVCDVLDGAGVPSRLVAEPVPTPLIAWGLRHLGAAAAVVVTASHNPAKDNGIKIYWGDGAQIVPPVDRWIADAIDRAALAGNPPGSGEPPDLAAPSLVDDYVRMVDGLVGPTYPERADLRVAYTAMHGVGHGLLRRCFDTAGFTQLSVVEDQRDADPDFPTVPFPNPEEAGATDHLLALAASIDADVAFANDPDADRLAMAVPAPDGWRLLTGDELGALFAAGLMADRRSMLTPLLVTTVVSSQLLAAIAAHHDAVFEETLTGFKWLCRPGFAHPELDQVLAYEESIGYAVGGLCDKDGISAAVVMADLVTGWKAIGITPLAVLDDLTRLHGAHVTDNFSIRVDGPGAVDTIAAAAARFVAAPPAALAGVAVARVDQPADDVVRCFLANGDRVVVRPSGTEPKLKVYCEAVEPVGADNAPEEARARARLRLAALRSEVSATLALG